MEKVNGTITFQLKNLNLWITILNKTTSIDPVIKVEVMAKKYVRFVQNNKNHCKKIQEYRYDQLFKSNDTDITLLTFGIYNGFKILSIISNFKNFRHDPPILEIQTNGDENMVKGVSYSLSNGAFTHGLLCAPNALLPSDEQYEDLVNHENKNFEFEPSLAIWQEILSNAKIDAGDDIKIRYEKEKLIFSGKTFTHEYTGAVLFPPNPISKAEIKIKKQYFSNLDKEEYIISGNDKWIKFLSLSNSTVIYLPGAPDPNIDPPKKNSDDDDSMFEDDDDQEASESTDTDTTDPEDDDEQEASGSTENETTDPQDAEVDQSANMNEV